MTQDFHGLRSRISACLMVASGGTAQAQGQVYVLESTAASVKVGTAYGMGDRITIPAGASVRVVMPSGKTQTIKGPYSGPAADLAKGQKPNDGVVAWIKNLIQTGGSQRENAGRDAQRTRARAARGLFLDRHTGHRPTARSASRKAQSCSCGARRRQARIA